MDDPVIHPLFFFCTNMVEGGGDFEELSRKTRGAMMLTIKFKYIISRSKSSLFVCVPRALGDLDGVNEGSSRSFLFPSLWLQLVDSDLLAKIGIVFYPPFCKYFNFDLNFFFFLPTKDEIRYLFGWFIFLGLKFHAQIDHFLWFWVRPILARLDFREDVLFIIKKPSWYAWNNVFTRPWISQVPSFAVCRIGLSSARSDGPPSIKASGWWRHQTLTLGEYWGSFKSHEPRGKGEPARLKCQVLPEFSVCESHERGPSIQRSSVDVYSASSSQEEYYYHEHANPEALPPVNLPGNVNGVSDFRTPEHEVNSFVVQVENEPLPNDAPEVLDTIMFPLFSSVFHLRFTLIHFIPTLCTRIVPFVILFYNAGSVNSRPKGKWISAAYWTNFWIELHAINWIVESLLQNINTGSVAWQTYEEYTLIFNLE